MDVLTRRVARPTVYAGVQMRSRTEADYAAWLDQRGDRWEYEPRCFAGPTGQWLPDFLLGTKHRTFVELKPALSHHEMSIELIDGYLSQMSVAWLSEPEATLMLQFWKWGEGQKGHIIAHGSKDRIWWACPMANGFIAGIWRGMGQLDRLKASV